MQTNQFTTSPLKEKLNIAVADTQPQTKARNKALASVRWVLFCAAGYAALTPDARCIFVEEISGAQVFDGRDNEELKARFWGVQLSTKLETMLLP